MILKPLREELHLRAGGALEMESAVSRSPYDRYVERVRSRRATPVRLVSTIDETLLQIREDLDFTNLGNSE